MSAVFTPHEPFADFLRSDGWTECSNRFRSGRCFYKRFATPTRCHCNDDKDGIQVQVAVTDFNGRESYELEIAGELKDGTWVILQNYSLPADLREAIALVPRLVSTWEAANK